jgi:CheY-like chemotaxis protein
MHQYNIVLLVDDDYVNNFLTEKFLKRTKIAKTIKSVRNGEEALTFLSEEKNECPELIFLDLNMPEMDGINFLKYFKKMVLNKSIKVVLLTGHVGDKQKKVLEELGFPDVVEKPLTETKLYPLIEKYQYKKEL